tara:strand:- start:1067 stop:1561 length:495 start_codon:yes stop_codon:yes gene_type:complete
MTDINWAAANNAYQSAPTPSNGDSRLPIPDGSYKTKVHSTTFNMSQAGKLYLFWVLEILEGANAGRNLIKRNMMVTETNMSHLKKDVAMCGVNPPASLEVFSDADERIRFLKSLLDVELMCTQKTQGEFVDVYFDTRLSAAPPQEPATGSMGVTNTFADDDVPF